MKENKNLLISTVTQKNINSFLNLLVQWKIESKSLEPAQKADFMDSTRAFFWEQQEDTIAFLTAFSDSPNEKNAFWWLSKWEDNEGQTKAFSNEFWVRSDCRGEGIGQALMDKGLAWAKDMQASQFLLYVAANNQGAIHFYEKNGFEKQPEEIFHKHINNQPTLTPPKNIIIQERKKGESDQALWRLSKIHHCQKPTNANSDALTLEAFKKWQTLWDFDKEETLLVFKAYEKDQTTKDKLIGYVWGENITEKNDQPTFLIHEWMTIRDYPDREKINLHLLKWMIHTLFKQGFNNFQAFTQTDFQRSNIKALGFQPSNYLMIKILSGKQS